MVSRWKKGQSNSCKVKHVRRRKLQSKATPLKHRGTSWRSCSAFYCHGNQSTWLSSSYIHRSKDRTELLIFFEPVCIKMASFFTGINFPLIKASSETWKKVPFIIISAKFFKSSKLLWHTSWKKTIMTFQNIFTKSPSFSFQFCCSCA